MPRFFLRTLCHSHQLRATPASPTTVSHLPVPPPPVLSPTSVFLSPFAPRLDRPLPSRASRRCAPAPRRSLPRMSGRALLPPKTLAEIQKALEREHTRSDMETRVVGPHYDRAQAQSRYAIVSTSPAFMNTTCDRVEHRPRYWSTGI